MKGLYFIQKELILLISEGSSFLEAAISFWPYETGRAGAHFAAVRVAPTHLRRTIREISDVYD